MRAELHPLYSNPELLRAITKLLLEQGHSVLQLFQMPPGEREHSNWILGLSDPKRTARRVLSLGCGVGGMENYWKQARPELEFELVNIAQPQLDLCLCEGVKVCADAATYQSPAGQFDLVVMAYLLGHLDPPGRPWEALRNAYFHVAPGGRLVIYDVFNGTKYFQDALFYHTVTLSWLELFGVSHNLHFREVRQGGIPLGEFAKREVSWAADEVMPALFVFQK